jgi:hypothetical protein
MLKYNILRILQPKDILVQQIRREVRKNKRFDKIILWIEIIQINAEQERKELIRLLGLVSHATWKDIIQANDKLDKPIQSYPD